ncbi:MAG: ornithine--oxo-acid transaminase [Candidatus Eisenbacteria bacterium]|uniref:ornithine aminotransferase n=1 Tax=Eiseniibacteriota bacterium TaxID=2212470 RepID=A0A937XBF6_UNCEI|nr:ornithine--oxo-acid transaminase [Candidatus Eisenbacteria bacterium]
MPTPIEKTAPASRGAEMIRLAETYSARNYHPLDVAIERAERVWVWDADGRRYLDCLSAYSALNQGHRHPAIIRALVEQAQKVTLTSRAFHNAEMGPFLQELCAYTGMDQALPMNTGAEAVETAIKAARRWGYRVKGVPRDQAEIIVCDGNFHGRTTTVISFSPEESYRAGFGPFTPGFKIIPYGDLEALRGAVTAHTVGFLFEPIQGEGGVIVPPPGYLRGALEICRRERVLFMDDEIQTGFGRTGRRFCCDHEDVRPDMLILGKALGGGVYPVSAVCASREILGVFDPGSHGSTFGGNPLAAAVARAALRVVRDERLAERSDELGAYFMGELRRIASPAVAEVRGRGLLVGVVIRKEAGSARPYCEALREEGILAKETHDQVIRFAPPLVIEREEIDWMLPRIAKVLAR